MVLEQCGVVRTKNRKEADVFKGDANVFKDKAVVFEVEQWAWRSKGEI
jgi:hypothetical protein